MNPCPDCGAQRCQELCHELAGYTLAHPDAELFIHQYMVDAYALQHAARNPKSITTVFALIGLYLFAEKGCTGKQVQLQHMRLARSRKSWPAFPAPKARAELNVADVLAAAPGEQRDQLIRRWALSVWGLWKPQSRDVAALLEG